jgi:hypothetical protein
MSEKEILGNILSSSPSNQNLDSEHFDLNSDIKEQPSDTNNNIKDFLCPPCVVEVPLITAETDISPSFNSVDNVERQESTKNDQISVSTSESADDSSDSESSDGVPKSSTWKLLADFAEEESSDSEYNPFPGKILVGPEYQVDIDYVLNNFHDTPEELNQKGGQLVYRPDMISETDLDNFLKMAQFDPGVSNWHYPSVRDLIPQHSTTNFVSFNDCSVKSNVTFDKKKIMTQEEILSFLHQHNYNIQEALEELRRDGKSWHPTKPDFPEWTYAEICAFERGFEQYSRKFSAIQSVVRTKTVAEIIQFWYFWKSLPRYRELKRQHAHRQQFATYLSYPVAPPKENVSGEHPRDPRLRNRPRLDYSVVFSRGGGTAASSQIKEFGELSLKKRKRSPESDSLLPPLEVGIYADIDWDRIRTLKRMCLLDKNAPESDKDITLCDNILLTDVFNCHSDTKGIVNINTTVNDTNNTNTSDTTTTTTSSTANNNNNNNNNNNISSNDNMNNSNNNTSSANDNNSINGSGGRDRPNNEENKTPESLTQSHEAMKSSNVVQHEPSQQQISDVSNQLNSDTIGSPLAGGGLTSDPVIVKTTDNSSLNLDPYANKEIDKNKENNVAASLSQTAILTTEIPPLFSELQSLGVCERNVNLSISEQNNEK